MEKQPRIAKYISRCGICSRREAERLISEGVVMVNGEIIDNPATLVSDNDVVMVHGKKVEQKEPTRLWIYHKPVGLVTSHDDPEGRPTVFASLPNSLPQHIISVGRLDLNSEGLLLLTNNGELSRYFELPATGWRRKYRVRIRGVLQKEVIRQLKKGVTIEEVTYRGIEVEPESSESQKANGWAIVTLSEGKNREIRRVFEHFGHPVSRLIRTHYGPFQLGNLPQGEVREVSRTALKNALGKSFPLE